MTRRTDGPFVVYEILPGQLYQRGKLHNTPIDKKLAGLCYYGITYSVALAPRLPDEDLQLSAGMYGYLHKPIPDGRLVEDLLPISMQMAEEIRHGGKVLTMCNAGRNRSGLLSALIVRELTGLPGYAAMNVVRHHRPRAIANPHFEEFLRSLP